MYAHLQILTHACVCVYVYAIKNQEWGYRDIGDVEEAAKSHRLELTRTLDMPANNHVLLFTKQ